MPEGAERRRRRLERNLTIDVLVQTASRGAVRVSGRFPLMGRWASHLTLLSLAVAVVLVGRSVGLVRSNSTADRPAKAEAPRPIREVSARGVGGFLVRAAVPRTVAGERSQPSEMPTETPVEVPTPVQAQPTAAVETTGIRMYTVQPGDTVLALAQRFGITPDTILAANDSLAGNPDLLQVGQQLRILPVSGVLHTVVAGDTLSSIAQRYQVSIEAIVNYRGNNLSAPYILHPGDTLVVPGGVWSAPVHSGAAGEALAGGAPANAKTKATGSFLWPTKGYITQGTWARHVAIDIGARQGTPIVAADAGYVLEAGWSRVGYGQYVIIDHANGFRTLYAHMSVILVKRGQWVNKGQRIGLVGSTGNSTGPHLHFEVYKNGRLQPPLNYLP